MYLFFTNLGQDKLWESLCGDPWLKGKSACGDDRSLLAAIYPARMQSSLASGFAKDLGY